MLFLINKVVRGVVFLGNFLRGVRFSVFIYLVVFELVVFNNECEVIKVKFLFVSLVNRFSFIFFYMRCRFLRFYLINIGLLVNNYVGYRTIIEYLRYGVSGGFEDR